MRINSQRGLKNQNRKEDKKDCIRGNTEGVQTTEKITDDSKVPQVNSPFCEVTEKATSDRQQNCVRNTKAMRGWIH